MTFLGKGLALDFHGRTHGTTPCLSSSMIELVTVWYTDKPFDIRSPKLSGRSTAPSRLGGRKRSCAVEGTTPLRTAVVKEQQERDEEQEGDLVRWYED